jgi:hypothetical protein
MKQYRTDRTDRTSRVALLLVACGLSLFVACMPSAPTVNYAQPAQVQSAPAQPQSDFQQPPPAGSREILAEGKAAIIGGDKGIARDHALTDAQRKAVEQGVGTLLKSETEVKNFQLVWDKISTKSTGYVSSYRVIDEQSTSDLYTVTIKAVVKLADLESDVQGILNLVEAQGRPRLMILVRDTKEGSDELSDPQMASDLETMVIDKFVGKGFPVVDAEMVKRNTTNDQIKLIMSGDNKTASLLGMKLGAEIVLAGKATASTAQKSDPYTNTMREVYGTKINARAINAATAEILTAALINKQLPFSEDQSRSGAAEDLSDKMISDILKKWQVQNIVTQIFCTNADNTKLKALQDGLNQNMRGLTSARLRDFTGNSGMIEVLTTTASQEVYDRLNQTGWTVPFTIKGFGGNRIDLEFK